MWESNDYRRGWEDGHQDGIHGRDKNFLRMGLSLRFWIFGGDNILQTYVEGYNEGYAHGIAERHIVHRVEPMASVFARDKGIDPHQGGTSNSKDQSTVNDIDMTQTSQDFIRELQALKDLHEFLVRFTDQEIMDKLNEYHGAIQAMIDSGVPRQQCETYINNHFQADKARYQDLLQHIVSSDLPRIQYYISEVSSHMQAATQMSLGDIRLSQPNTSPRATRPRQIISRQGDVADLIVQADAICDFGDFLRGVVTTLHNNIQTYERYCASLLDNGVPQQMYNDYVSQFASPDVQQIRRIIGGIESEDIPYLQRVLNQITQSITGLGGSYARTMNS